MEANWPMIALLAFVTCIAAYIGRVWFKRWFNPLTIYSAVWGFCLVAYELRLIQYYDLSGRAWALIVAAWASLYLGALLAVLFTAARNNVTVAPTDLKRMRLIIWVFTIVGAVGVVDEIFVLYRQFGSVFEAVFLNACTWLEGTMRSHIFPTSLLLSIPP